MKCCRQLILDRQADAHSSKKKCKPLERPKGSLERNELLKTVKRLGRAVWKK